MNRIKKFFGMASAGVLVAGVLVGGTLATAGTAHAAATDCLQYLPAHGYLITADRSNACYHGARGGLLDMYRCDVRLRDTGVPANHSATACRLAADR
ncbi:hypothetical protein ACWGIB_05870 [Streptomyces xiamenensis]